jgi:CubicO group peptidase (beta-lactamase class C family)
MLSPRRIRRACAVAALALVPAAGNAAPAVADPGDVATSPAELTRTYRGADGSALYTRAVGDTVVGLGEHPGKGPAFVFKGTRSGMTISGRWWDVAKGWRTRSEEIELEYSDGGARLERSGGADLGPDSWEARDPHSMKWPGRAEAGFQSLSSHDLDGAFDGSDGSRAYVRETADDVVWVAERTRRGSRVGARPRYATVFVGERTSGDEVSGEWYDVPKGTLLRHGSLTGSIGGSPREITGIEWRGPGGSWTQRERARSYVADYAVDLDRFAQEIEEHLEPYVVGYGYAIAADGQVVRQGAGGARRVPQPGNTLTAPFAFTPTTVNETASTTKTITAVAVMRELKRKGLSLDAKVNPYLPVQWERGPGMTTVTFRQLLAHGGLANPGGICDTDYYGCLEEAVRLGMTSPPGYDNIHYALMRVILPFMHNQPGMRQLFADLPDETARNLAFSDAFRDYVVDMLELGGITADTEYPPSRNLAWRYAWGTPPTNEFFPAKDEEDYLHTGPGGFKMSAVEYAQFLGGFEHGRFLSLSAVRELKADWLGFDDKTLVGSAAIGPLYTKTAARAAAPRGR